MTELELYERFMKNFDRIAKVMMIAKGYKSVDNFTDADIAELTA
jgi:hypothetical protein